MITIAIGIFLGWLIIMVVSTGTILAYETVAEVVRIANVGKAIREGKIKVDNDRVKALIRENERNHAKR